MKKEELIEWFCTKFNSCYPVSHTDYTESIFLFYDEQFIRKMKLSKISKKPVSLPKKVNGICLFELDWKNKRFVYDYDEIYTFLYNNYSTIHLDITNFIVDQLKNTTTKLNVLTPGLAVDMKMPQLKDTTKLDVLTPARFFHKFDRVLKDTTKLDVLIPRFQQNHILSKKDTTKLDILTTKPYLHCLSQQMKDTTKLNVLTPKSGKEIGYTILKDTTKLNVLTPIVANPWTGIIQKEK